jgi:hypothetical protein
MVDLGKQSALLDFARNGKSQCGEDGLLVEIFRRIGVKHKWCCEFGAWDGEHLSNSWIWLNQAHWSGVLLEPDSASFQNLSKLYKHRDDVHCLEEFVGESNPLDQILENTPIPLDFDLLVVDVDGNDYWIWKKMERYRPRVVVIEINSSMPTSLHFIQKNDTDCFIGSSISAMTSLAKSKGYELVGCLGGNAIYVLKEEFEKLELEDNSIERIFNSPYLPILISDQLGRHFILRVGSYGISKDAPHNPGHRFSVVLGAPLETEEIELILTKDQEKIVQLMQPGWEAQKGQEMGFTVKTFDKKPNPN